MFRTWPNQIPREFQFRSTSLLPILEPIRAVDGIQAILLPFLQSVPEAIGTSAYINPATNQAFAERLLFI